MKLFLRLLSAGLLAGLILGGLLKGIEFISGKQVYVLLLNVDYIPVINEWSMTEAEEFLLHLLVSLVIVFVLYGCLKWTRRQIPLFMIGGIIIGGAYFPLTALSGRTPDVTDLEALMYWLLVHSVYGLTAGSLIFYKKDRGVR